MPSNLDQILIPKPRSYTPEPGELRLNMLSWIASEKVLSGAASLLQESFKRFLGLDLNLTGLPAPDGKGIKIVQSGQSGSAADGYSLQISAEGIVLEGPTLMGILNGINALRQIAAGRPESLSACRISDDPLYPWRGVHLDVSRHFFGVEKVKKLIDLAALHRLNIFHWHLTDDQGWRIQIDSYPKLNEVSSFRTEKDGTRTGGYYTKEEVRDVVAYAQRRGVTIVPEIEMPGHAQAVVAAYPEFACSDGPFEVWNWWGISKEVYCAGKEETFDFLGKVLAEVAELFPGDYIHVGGDECPKDRWHACPDCKERMRSERIETGEELQSYFITRMGRVIEKLGKKLIGWDEILEGGLAPGAMVMSWRGTEGGLVAAQAGHNAVMCPESHCYFDHKQGLSEDSLGPTHYPFPPVLLKTVYSFDPRQGIEEEAVRGYIKGGQGNIWTEAMDTWDRLEHMVFPRLIALAEALWLPPEERDWKEFFPRLQRYRKVLDNLDVNYSKEPETWKA